jgi:hypothetical protein
MEIASPKETAMDCLIFLLASRYFPRLRPAEFSPYFSTPVSFVISRIHDENLRQ